MATTTLKLPSTPVPSTPRGAHWAATAFATVWQAVSKAVEAVMRQRARAARLRATQEVLRLADVYQANQPSFAAELRAAATRMSADQD